MQNPVTLFSESEIEIRYNEADPMGIVWHGHYIQYFENGREAFGKKYGIGYAQVEALGFTLPVVNINCSYKSPLRYGDKTIIQTTFINSNAAKLEFSYKIIRAKDNTVAATGTTTQVFLDKKGTMQLIAPTFFSEWKSKYGI